MEDQNQDKFLARFAKMMEEQTVEPTKKVVSTAVSKFYAQQKKNKKANDGAAAGENKTKRAPTAYNVFFKEQMAILKEKETGLSKDECMTAKAKMAHVAELWKSKKEEHFEEAPEEPEPEPESDKDEEEPEPPKPAPEPVKAETKAKFGGGGKGNGAKFGGGGKNAKGGKTSDN